MHILLAIGLIGYAIYWVATLPAWVWWTVGLGVGGISALYIAGRVSARHDRRKFLREQDERRERERNSPPQPGESLEDSIKRKFSKHSSAGLDKVVEQMIGLEEKGYVEEALRRLWGTALAEYVKKNFWSLMSDAEQELIASHIESADSHFFEVFEPRVKERAAYLKVAHRSESMTPIEFEKWCARILRTTGWQTRETTTTGDQGADVVADKDGLRLVVQCKLYSRPVGNKAVQEVHAAKAHYGACFSAVVTNSSFTPSAKALAASTGVILLHADELIKIGHHLN